MMKRLLLSLLTIPLLSACGFSPMYGTNSAVGGTTVKSQLNQIDIAPIPDRSGQYLRNALIDQFYVTGYPAKPTHRLEISPIREAIYAFDITAESEATRQQIKLLTQIRLVDLKTKKPVLTRDLTAITSNNILESEFSTLITEQSARDAALNDLARQIERQVALSFAN